MPTIAAARLRSPLWALSQVELWIAISLVALTYASVAALCLAVAIPPGYASALWPPAGIALAAWLAYGGRIWPGILLGAVLANLGVSGTSLPVALAIGAGNAAEAALAGLLIRRVMALEHRFEHPAAVWRFAALAGGVTTLALAGQVPWADFGVHWLTWWLGDATGIVIVAPLLLCWSAPAGARSAVERRAEYPLFVALLALCGGFALAIRLPADIVQTLAYLMIPLVTWAAARLDQRAVTAASFAISAVAVIDMLDGSASLFSPLSLNASLLLLQLFVSAVALTGLTLSAFAGEIERVKARLDVARAELERALARLEAHAAGPAQGAPESALLKRLNARERAVLALVADGHTSAEVGGMLHLSPRTIESYRSRIMQKLEIPSFAGLIQFAVRNGIATRKS
jgi:integral membrane sensor domain MASE1/DNA-binding CsgD family transcriptional regulator